jgi:short subunit dehydrogenase-like uncharacterized protein
MTSNRQYDLVLLGPTGYTGQFCAEHIVQNHPTDLKWAIAGRSMQKMEPIAKQLKALNPDRVEPGTWPCYSCVSDRYVSKLTGFA